MNDSTRTELEAAAFRRLVSHLRGRNDVQNIDMMNLAGFCRNCLCRWYREEAADKGLKMDDAAAREIVYGMDYDEWKAKYQTKATAEQLTHFIERIERLEEEKRALMADIRDVYSEAKGTGFEPKIMRQLVKMRAMDRELLQEQDELLETYRAAVGLV